MGVVVFAKVRGQVNFERTQKVRGLLDFTSPLRDFGFQTVIMKCGNHEF